MFINLWTENKTRDVQRSGRGPEIYQDWAIETCKIRHLLELFLDQYIFNAYCLTKLGFQWELSHFMKIKFSLEILTFVFSLFIVNFDTFLRIYEENL